MFDIQLIDLPLVFRLQPFHYNFVSSPNHLQTYTRSRYMYAYQTFNTPFCVLTRVLADILRPTACSTRFSGKVFLISTVSVSVFPPMCGVVVTASIVWPNSFVCCTPHVQGRFC